MLMIGWIQDVRSSQQAQFVIDSNLFHQKGEDQDQDQSEKGHEEQTALTQECFLRTTSLHQT